MAVVKKRLELTCVICSLSLASTQAALSEDVLVQQNIYLKRKTNKFDGFNSKIKPVSDRDQTISTKCGHMFHMGCLRDYIKTHVDRVGTAPCPICSKPVTLTRLWPVLIPPTAAQVSRSRKLQLMKKENTSMRLELAETQKHIKASEAELVSLEYETETCLTDTKIKQKQLDELNGPTKAEHEKLKRIQKHRQSIVQVVTKHNADLLGVLMHETNVQISETDLISISDKDVAADVTNNNVKQGKVVAEGSSNQPTRRNNNSSKKIKRKSRVRGKK